MGLFGNSFNNKDSNKNSSKDDKGYDEAYLIGIFDVEESKLVYIMSKTRKEFGRLLMQLSTKRYTVVGVQMLQNVEEYGNFLKALGEQNKPNDLEFGDDKEKEVGKDD